MIFDDVESLGTLDEISHQLIQDLRNEPSDSNRAWTKAITNSLCQIQKRPEIMVCCHGSKEGEWLLDVVWFECTKHKIVLAVECEWGKPGDVEDDFDKLMSIKSPRKLLLFNTKNHQEVRSFIDPIESNMRKYPYHLPGEQYVLLEVTGPACYRYSLTIPNDAPLSGMHFGDPERLDWPWRKGC